MKKRWSNEKRVYTVMLNRAKLNNDPRAIAWYEKKLKELSK